MAEMKQFLLQTPAQLAHHLRSFRRVRGLTQAQLGRLLKVDQSRIARIERNPERVSVQTVLQLLAKLRVRVLLAPADRIKASANRTADW
jgi:HTH-type transcriptional regulator/antitoxin HipB